MIRALDQIEHFFVAYNGHQGREFEPTGRYGPQEAEKCLDKAIAALPNLEAR